MKGKEASKASESEAETIQFTINGLPYTGKPLQNLYNAVESYYFFIFWGDFYNVL